jgi:hypothetical protein
MPRQYQKQQAAYMRRHDRQERAPLSGAQPTQPRSKTATPRAACGHVSRCRTLQTHTQRVRSQGTACICNTRTLPLPTASVATHYPHYKPLYHASSASLHGGDGAGALCAVPRRHFHQHRHATVKGRPVPVVAVRHHLRLQPERRFGGVPVSGHKKPTGERTCIRCWGV